MKRPERKIKLDVVKPPLSLHFSESVGQRKISVYVMKLSEAVNQGAAVQIDIADAYMKKQLKNAAEKLGLRLVYAIADNFLYVKPIAVDGERKRLMLQLREPRAETVLMAAKFELNLPDTLSDFAKQGIAHKVQRNGSPCWVLTEKGMDALA
jgi:hypothetical protein